MFIHEHQSLANKPALLILFQRLDPFPQQYHSISILLLLIQQKESQQKC